MRDRRTNVDVDHPSLDLEAGQGVLNEPRLVAVLVIVYLGFDRIAQQIRRGKCPGTVRAPVFGDVEAGLDRDPRDRRTRVDRHGRACRCGRGGHGCITRDRRISWCRQNCLLLGGRRSCRHSAVDGALENSGEFVVKVDCRCGFGLDGGAPYRDLGTTTSGRRQTNTPDATDAGIHRSSPLLEHAQELYDRKVKGQHTTDEQSECSQCGSGGPANPSPQDNRKKVPDHTTTDAGTGIAGHDKKLERQQDTQNEYGHPGQLPAAAMVGVVLATNEHQDANDAHKQR